MLDRTDVQAIEGREDYMNGEPAQERVWYPRDNAESPDLRSRLLLQAGADWVVDTRTYASSCGSTSPNPTKPDNIMTTTCDCGESNLSTCVDWPVSSSDFGKHTPRTPTTVVRGIDALAPDQQERLYETLAGRLRVSLRLNAARLSLMHNISLDSIPSR